MVEREIYKDRERHKQVVGQERWRINMGIEGRDMWRRKGLDDERREMGR